MALDLLKERGIPLAQQSFSWRDLVMTPISKLDDDAFTRVRAILMNSIETEALRFSHAMARLDGTQRLAMAEIRRIEKQQQTMVNWLLPADQSVLETTVAYEQVAVEVTASLAEKEPDAYIKRVLNFGLLEDFDHLYRYSALLDRLEGKDANNILQSYTDVRPGRPTAEHHRSPLDDVRMPFDRRTASGITKLNVMTIIAAENQTMDFYANVGPMYADPLARELYAEISSIEEQHVTQYESLLDPTETPLGQWLLHEANEVYNYFSCAQDESDPRVKAIWDRFLAWELGHLHVALDIFRSAENRDPLEVIPRELPEPIRFESHRGYVRSTLENEVNLRPLGTLFVDQSQLPSASPSLAYRSMVNAKGSPSEVVAASWKWTPGTEVALMADRMFSAQEARP
jgi:rubrerythrin